jgi:hypothetical protein
MVAEIESSFTQHIFTNPHKITHMLLSNCDGGTGSIFHATLASRVLKTDGALQAFNFSNFFDGHFSDARIPGFLTYAKDAIPETKKLGSSETSVSFYKPCRKQTAIIYPALSASTQQQ